MDGNKCRSLPSTWLLVKTSPLSIPRLAGIVGAGSEPFRIDFDPTGKFVYVTNEGSAVSIYTVNTDGTLAGPSDTGVPGVATALAVGQ